MWVDRDTYNFQAAADFEDETPDPFQPARDALQFARDTAGAWQPAQWANDAADFARSTAPGMGDVQRSGQVEQQAEPAPAQEPMSSIGDAFGNAGEAVGNAAGAAGQAIGAGLQTARNAIPTTVQLGENPQSAAPTGNEGSLLQRIGEIAQQHGLDPNVAKAIGITEGGLDGAVGDNGQSFGIFQFYKGGQLANFAKSLGVDLATAGKYATDNPEFAADWALRPGGYLGDAIRRGVEKGLSGSDLATFAQRTGQVSVSPERAGQNYARAAGTGDVQRSGQPDQGQAPYSFPVAGYSGKDVPLHWGSNSGGTDLFAAEGTPVVAMRGGKVISSSTDSIGGNAVLIQGDDGNQYYYAHLNQTPAVKAGQVVGAGDYLGGVGDTGNAKGTGAHLHMGIGPSIVNGAGPQGGTGGDFNAVGLLRNVLAGGVPAIGDALGNAGRAVGNAWDQATTPRSAPDMSGVVEPGQRPNPGVDAGRDPGFAWKAVQPGMGDVQRSSATGEAPSVGDMLGRAGETVGGAMGRAGEGLQAANEAVAPYNIFTRGANAVAGREQVRNENPELYRRIDELQNQVAAGDESVLPELQALIAQSKQLNIENPEEAAKRSPDYERLQNTMMLGEGAIAMGIAPTLASGPVRNAIAAGIDPVGQVMGGGLEAAGRGTRAFNQGEMGAIRLPGGKVPEAPMPTTKPPWDVTAAGYDTMFPRVGDLVDGRVVRAKVPNISSIESSVDNPTVVSGIREVPVSAFEDSGPPAFYSVTEEQRTKALADSIKTSGEIDPLIVVYDANGPYILEGGHRFDALKLLGARSFPAKVVFDEDSLYDAVALALRDGKPVSPEVLADYPDLAAKYPMPTTRAAADADMVAATGRQIQQADLPNGNITREGLATNNPRGAEALRLAEEAPPARPPVEPPAPPAGPPPVDPAFAGNIRLSKYVDEDVQGLITRTHDADPAAFEEARRGVQPDEAVRQMARETGAKVDDLIKRWKPGDAENAETIFAVRGTLKAKTREVATLSRAIREGDDSTAALVKLQRSMEEQRRVQEVTAGLTAEAGRGLRQFTMGVDDVLLSGDDEKIRKLLEKMGGRERTEGLAGALAKIDPNDEQAMFDFLRNAQKPEMNDYLVELWYNSILSAPPSHVANFATNAFMAAKEPISRVVAAAVEVPTAKLQGRARERFFGEAGRSIYGIGQGIPEGARRWLYMMKNGYTFDEVVRLDLRKTQAFKGKTGAVINTPTRELAASDALFRAINYSSALHGNAYRMAAREGLGGEGLGQRVAELIANPPELLMAEAGKISKYNVFQADPGTFTEKLIGIRNADVVLPALGKTQPVRFAMPFLHTPMNLLKVGLENSPMGVLNPKMWASLKKGSPEFSDQAARVLQGSVVAGAMGALVGQGLVDIVGEAPSSPADRDRFYADGKIPNSIRFGPEGNPYHGFQKLEPLNQTFAQVAAVIDAVRYGQENEATIGKLATRAVATLAKNFVSQTYMSGLSDAIDAMSDWDRYGGQFVERIATGFMFPSGALRTAARATDATVRDPDNLAEAAMAQVPGLTQKVPAKLTATGEDVQRATPWWSPFQEGAVDKSPLAREASRLEFDIGFVGDAIEGVKLTREEAHQYQQVNGQLLKEMLPELMSIPEYGVVGDKDKAAALQKAKGKIGTAAKQIMMQRMGDGFIDRYIVAHRRQQ